MNNDALNKLIKTLTVYIIIILSFLFVTSRTYAEDLIGSWSFNTSLPYRLASQTILAYNNRIIIIGGSETFGQSKYDTISSSTSSNGGRLTWQIDNTPVPSALIFHAEAAEGSHVYILAGKEEDEGSSLSLVNNVWKGDVGISGKIDNWAKLNGLPKAVALGESVVVNGKIYFLGGYSQNASKTEYNSEIYAANVNGDGTLGNWGVVGHLPQAMSSFGLVENNGHLIVVGGRGSESTFRQVYTAVINGDGTIGNWRSTNSLPQNLARAGVVKVGSYIFVVGGQDDNSFSTNVYYTTVNDDGTVQPWTLSQNHLPQGVCCGATTVANGYIYLTGGYNGNYLDTVYMAKLNITSNSDTLDVPYFSQNVTPWGSSEYDDVLSLGGTKDDNMDRWGCAITSAAMVLKFNGMNELPDGTAVDPGSLNQWLKNNSGYVTGKGKDGWYSYFDWNAVAVLTRKLYNSGKSAGELMHQRAYPSASTTTLLNNDLAQFPDILQVKNTQTTSHFIVAKGIMDNTYAVNDPEWNYTDLTAFGNTYYQVDRYIPSHTDFGYLEAVVNPNVNILVTDSQGRRTGIDAKGNSFHEIPGASYSFQAPISNPDITGNPQSLGTGVNEFLLPTPEVGSYSISISSSGNGPYTLNLITYDKNGDNLSKKYVGTASKSGDVLATVGYQSDSPAVIHKNVTPASFFNDLQALIKLKYLSKKGLVIALFNNLASLAKNNERHNRFDHTKLVVIQKFLGMIFGNNNSNDGYKILMDDLAELQNS